MEPIPRSPVGVGRRNAFLGAVQESSTTVQNATLRGHEEQSCDLRGGRKPLLDFKIAGARRRAGSGGLGVVEKTGAKYF